MNSRLQLAALLGERPSPRLPLGIDPLDAALGGGVPVGGITEILSEPGHGGWWLASRVLSALTKPIGILNHDDTLHPPGLTALGVDMAQALVVCTSTKRDALWSLERMAKHSDLGATVCWMVGLRDVDQRRLQLAAERSGQVVLMLSSEGSAGRASWGALRVKVESQRSVSNEARSLIVTTLRGRGGITPVSVRIEVEHGTNAVRGAAVVSHPAHHASLRSAGA